jgi:hypothetical protein
MKISLHIDELVLHGFGPGDRYAIAAGMQSELTRLLTEQGLPRGMATGATWDRLVVPPVTMEAGTKPDVIGAQVARSVYEESNR